MIVCRKLNKLPTKLTGSFIRNSKLISLNRLWQFKNFSMMNNQGDNEPSSQLDGNLQNQGEEDNWMEKLAKMKTSFNGLQIIQEHEDELDPNEFALALRYIGNNFVRLPTDQKNDFSNDPRFEKIIKNVLRFMSDLNSKGLIDLLIFIRLSKQHKITINFDKNHFSTQKTSIDKMVQNKKITAHY